MQKDFDNVNIDLDFLGRSCTVEAIDFLVQIVIKNPDLYQNVVKILWQMLNFQPRETLTQIALHQVIALTTFTEMSSEMKPLDLRLSETLMHNLIRISDLVELQSLAVKIMSMVGKEVAPKWRLSLLRKLFQSGQASLVIESLHIFIHQFGHQCHPSVKELLANEPLSPKDWIVLSVNAGNLFCSFHKKTTSHRKLQGTQIGEDLRCLICSGDKEPEESTTGHNELFMNLFQRLIGHDDNLVKVNTVVNLLKPMGKHQVINAG